MADDTVSNLYTQCMQVEQCNQPKHILDFPNEILSKILRFMSFGEVAKKRTVIFF